eukprot:5772861-Alexandrium_andersonii.AAC.1
MGAGRLSPLPPPRSCMGAFEGCSVRSVHLGRWSPRSIPMDYAYDSLFAGYSVLVSSSEAVFNQHACTRPG